MINHPISRDHEFQIIAEVSHLIEHGYTCYLEEEIPLANSNQRKRGIRAVVDIYAVKGNDELIVEVGTLSPTHGDRLELLHRLKPHAKIIHVHQWKNYGINEDRIYRAGLDWKRNNLYQISDCMAHDLEMMGASLGNHESQNKTE